MLFSTLRLFFCSASLIAGTSSILWAEKNIDYSLIGYNHIAKNYNKGRPDYPPAAISLLVKSLNLEDGKTVLDLAAGTGKLTKALIGLDIRLSAVEPVEEMRALFTEQFAQIPIFNGKAEHIPALTNSLDAVMVGTAFHWFDTRAALNEIARVLKPGGGVGLIWNIFDGKTEWVQHIRCLLEGPNGALNATEWEKWQQAFKNHPSFSTLQHETISYSYPGTAKDVLNRVFSAKIMGTLTEPEQEEIIQKVLEILASNPSTQGKEVFDIPFRCEIYWCFLL